MKKGRTLMQAAKWSRRAVVAAAMAGIASGALQAPASAQDFPTKPITIVVPFGPGTTNDIIARQLAQDMTGTLGQSIIVENRAGATGNIATDFVAKSRPDGHTLLIASMSNILNQVTGNASSDLTKDFTPVAFSGKTPYSMMVPNELSAKNVAELVELARQQPGKLNYAGFVGGVPQFLGEMLNRAAKINTVMVPYKSTPDALVDLLANRIQLWFTPVASGIPVQSAKQARMLAVTGDTRARVLPDIPTFKEAGYPDLTVDVVYFLLAAKGTPQPVVDKLCSAIGKALENPKVKEALLAQGIEEKRGAPTEVGAYLAGEVARWGDIVKLSAVPGLGK
jgi:tripartite-type tricarboxylate transporter receptor subunit TctC